MNKYFKEVITHRCLDFKLSGIEGKLVDDLIEHKPEIAKRFKNLCAPIPLEIVDRLENTLNTLNLTKREFLTQAILSALDETQAIMDEIDITEYMDDSIFVKEEAKEAA